MSIQAYERLVGKHELYALLEASEQDVTSGRTKSLKDVMNDLRKELGHE